MQMLKFLWHEVWDGKIRGLNAPLRHKQDKTD